MKLRIDRKDKEIYSDIFYFVKDGMGLRIYPYHIGILPDAVGRTFRRWLYWHPKTTLKNFERLLKVLNHEEIPLSKYEMFDIQLKKILNEGGEEE